VPQGRAVETNDDLEILSSRQEDVLLLRVEGALSGTRALRAQEEFRRLLEAEDRLRAVLVDLEACASLDSLGAEALGELAHGQHVLVFGARGQVAAALTLLDLPAKVQIASRHQALKVLVSHPPGGSERRRSRRCGLSVPASMRFCSQASPSSEEVDTRTRDISEDGLGLEVSATAAARLAQAIASGGPEEVEIRVPPLFGQKWISGRLVAHDQEGSRFSVGVELGGLDPRARKLLRTLVERVLV
jgi:anti-anti-sigma regulatory factor